MVAAHKVEQLMAVHARHVDVADDKVDRLLFQPGDGRFATIGFDDFVVGQLEGVADRFSQVDIIFNDQNLHTIS